MAGISGGNAEAQEPASTIAIVQLAIAVISQFSGGNTDGLGAALNAQIALLQLISSQLDNVIKSLGDIEAQIEKLPEEIVDKLDQDRMKGYLYEIKSLSNKFTEKFKSEAFADEAQLAALKLDYVSIADAVQDSRGRLGNYNSAIPAIAAPIALAVEIAARRRAGQTAQLVPALDYYREWVLKMLDVKVPDSVMHSLDDLHNRHIKLMSECSALFDTNVTVCQVDGETPSRSGKLKACGRATAVIRPNGPSMVNETPQNDDPYNRPFNLAVSTETHIDMTVKVDPEFNTSDIYPVSISAHEIFSGNPVCAPIQVQGWDSLVSHYDEILKFDGNNYLVVDESSKLYKSNKLNALKIVGVKENLHNQWAQNSDKSIKLVQDSISEINIVRHSMAALSLVYSICTGTLHRVDEQRKFLSE